MKKAYFNWSSGKDSAMALYMAKKSGIYNIESLFTVINGDSGNISMHEVSQGLVKKQAEAMGMNIDFFQINMEQSIEMYERGMRDVAENFKKNAINTALFGDIYLEELRKKREKNCNKAGITAEFPLWGQNPKNLLKEFIEAGFKAIITCIDGKVLDESFVGRIIDESLMADFPENADICGENGEYHSFVFDGPIFKHPVEFKVEGKYYRDYGHGNKYWYLNIK